MERTTQKYRMRDYRSRKRLAKLKSSILDLNERIKNNKGLDEKSKKIVRSMVYLVSQEGVGDKYS